MQNTNVDMLEDRNEFGVLYLHASVPFWNVTLPCLPLLSTSRSLGRFQLFTDGPTAREKREKRGGKADSQVLRIVKHQVKEIMPPTSPQRTIAWPLYLTFNDLRDERARSASSQVS